MFAGHPERLYEIRNRFAHVKACPFEGPRISLKALVGRGAGNPSSKPRWRFAATRIRKSSRPIPRQLDLLGRSGG